MSDESKSVSQGPRLLPESEPGAAFANSYLLLTQICGLYAEIGRAATSDPRLRGQLTELGDEVLHDVGSLCLIWDKVSGAARRGTPVPVPVALTRRVALTCQRAAVLVRCLTIWEPLSRWLRLMAMLERRWEALAVSLAATKVGSPLAMDELAKRAAARAALLTGFGARREREVARMNEGGFGTDAGPLPKAG